MSKLYEKYKTLKQEKSSQILYLFRYGIFFIFLEDDARLVSQALGLKLGKLNDTVVKCGFPINSLDKYTVLLKNMGYTIEIIDNHTTSCFSSTNYLQNEQLEKLMQDVIKVDINTLSVREAYELLHKIQQQFSIIIENGGEIHDK